MQTLKKRGAEDGNFFHFERFQARWSGFAQKCEY